MVGESEVGQFALKHLGQYGLIYSMQQIEDYLLGKLSQKEIDLLWIEFLKDQEWFEMFERELMLRRLILIPVEYASPDSMQSKMNG